MPLKNGIQFDFGNVWLHNSSGEAVCKFTGVQEFDDTCYLEDPGDEIWGKIDYNREYNFTCHYDGAWKVVKKKLCTGGLPKDLLGEEYWKNCGRSRGESVNEDR